MSDYVPLSKDFNKIARESGYKGNATRKGYITKAYKKYYIKNDGNKPKWNNNIIFNPITNRIVKKTSILKGNTKKPTMKKKFEGLFSVDGSGKLTNKAQGLTGDHTYIAKNNSYWNYREFQNTSVEGNLGIKINITIENIKQILTALQMESKMLPSNKKSFSNYQKFQVMLGQEGGLMNSQTRIRTSFSPDIEYHLYEIKSKLEKMLEEYDDFEFPDTIIIKWVIDVPDGGQGVSKLSKKTLSTKEWYIFDTFSKTNCLWRSLYVCKNEKKHNIFAPKTITEGAKKMKKNASFEAKAFSTTDEIQKYIDFISNSKKSKIEIIGVHLYNELYEKVKTYTPTNNKKVDRFYEIQLSNNHYKPLLRWSNISLNKEELTAKYDEEKQNMKEDTNVIPTPKGLWKKSENGEWIRNIPKQNTKIACWDIEATENETIDGNFKAYMVGIAWYEETNEMYEKFEGMDCLTQFCDFLHKNGKKFHNYTFYAHNGGRFDLCLLFREALFTHNFLTLSKDGFVELNGSYINIVVNDDKQHKFTFKDSLKLLPQGLDKLCKDFKVKHQKLKETITFKDININNWNSYEPLPLYLKHDCFGLLEVMTTFSNIVHKECNINITDCFTGATLAKKNYFTNYYNAKYNPIYTLNEKDDRYCRNSYFGGRVECLSKMKEINDKIYYLDYTSLYPSQMVKDLPYDKPTNLNQSEAIVQLSTGKFFGFVRVNVRTIDKTKLPLHAYRDRKQKKLLFPIFNNWTQITIFSDEYYRGLKTGIYEYEILDAIQFQKKKFLKKATIDCFKKKEQADKEKNKAVKQCWKIILNSLYGFWGLRTQDREGVALHHNSDNAWVEHFHKGNLYNILEKDNYTICNIKRDLDVKTFNVAIASAITSYSRTYLYDLMTDIQEKGGKMYYCDTDSIMTNLDISKHKDLMKSYMWDGINDLSEGGGALGALKNEADEEFEDAGIDVKEQIKKDNGLIHFDKLILGGLKYYALKRGDIEICKCKGYSKKDKKLKFSDFENYIHKNIPIKQHQTQFKNPMSNHMSETNFMGISTNEIEKSFKMMYSKGIVDDNLNITPILVN